MSEDKEPLKCLGSVKTEMPTAPPFSMAWAISFGFTWFLIVPRDGEAALISVITGLTVHSKIAFFKLIFDCLLDTAVS